MHCPVVFIQEFYSNIHDICTFMPQFVSTFRGTRIVVTPDLISEVLHVPRVAHPNYFGCEHLQTMSRDNLISHFCGTHFVWGGKLNTPCLGFAKGPRFRNIVMTFTLTTLSHYNSIIEPCACFLLSLMVDLTINFPSHFITSIIDVYRDIATCDKLIFPSAITWILQHFSIPIPLSLLFSPLWVHMHWFFLVDQGPVLIEMATSGDNRSCSFCCSTLFLWSFYLRSFLL